MGSELKSAALMLETKTEQCKSKASKKRALQGSGVCRVF